MTIWVPAMAHVLSKTNRVKRLGVPLLSYVFRETGLTNLVEPDQTDPRGKQSKQYIMPPLLYSKIRV